MGDEVEPMILPKEGRYYVVTRVGIAVAACLAIALVLGLTLGLLLDPALPEDPLERALEIMSRYPLIDGHNDLPWVYRALVADAVWSLDISKSTGNETHTDIPRIREGKLGGQFWSVYVSCTSYFNKDAVRATQEQIDVVYQLVQRYPDFFQIATTADEVESIFNQGKFPSLMGMEGGHQIDNSLASLRDFYRSGVRYMTLTHNCNTIWAESCCDTNFRIYNPVGLTDFGKNVVREMNRLGMLVDISHASVNLMNAALDESIAPVIFSHSSVYALCPTSRNVPDAVLLRLKTNGGVVMMSFVPAFINCTNPESADISQVADHIDYIVNLIGVDYVGIGADYDGIPAGPQGLADVSRYPYLIAELYRRNYSDDDIVKIIGGNILRVLRAAESVAAQLLSDGAIPGQDVMTDVPNATCRTVY